MKKICYIVSGIDKALAFEWIHKKLDPEKYQLHFILLHHKIGDLETYLIDHNVPFAHIHYRNKVDLPIAILKAFNYLKKNKIEVVHCHLLDAGLVGLTSAFFLGIKKRIYSRHYSDYHHVYHPKGVYYDHLINRLSTTIIAVSHVVKRVLIERENVPSSKVEVVHHGFPMELFRNVKQGDIESLRKQYGMEGKYPVIGVISRYTEWKGIQYTIPAFQKLLERYPHAYLILANAKGDFKPYIRRQLENLPKHSYVEITFESNLFALFKCFDVFVHVPVESTSEAFGQVYIEALATETPSIFTLSGIANDIAVENKNALIANYKDSESIFHRLLALIEDKALAERLKQNGLETVDPAFELQNMMKDLEKIYG